MRLINIHTWELEDFNDEKQVQYAILSHRWEEDEVLYKHMRYKQIEAERLQEKDRVERVLGRKGWYKIEKCCQQARAGGLTYVWVDTCCINKYSSAELQEAINSMFRWYKASKICYAFLSDVTLTYSDRSSNPDYYELLKKSRWFERGWTLQELLAPDKVDFYDSAWTRLGDRESLKEHISCITNIPVRALKWFDPRSHCAASIMSWARGRETSRIEDRAYSLLGLFDVSLPMLYGEGSRAFLRLQEEILKYSSDQTLFAWEGVRGNPPGLLASSPDNFIPRPQEKPFASKFMLQRRRPLTVTSEGISLELDLVPVVPRIYLALLNLGTLDLSSRHGQSASEFEPATRQIGIFVKRLDREGRYARVPGSMIGDITASDLEVVLPMTSHNYERRTITIVHSRTASEEEVYRNSDLPGFTMNIFPGSSESRCRTISPQVWELSPQCDIESGNFDIRSSLWLRKRMGHGLVGIVNLKGLKRSPAYQGIGKVDIFVSRIAVGFDFDFYPTCVMILGDQDFRVAEIDAIIRTNRGLDPDAPRLDERAVKMQIDPGCIWKAIHPAFLVIKTKQISRDDGSGFRAQLTLTSTSPRERYLGIQVNRPFQNELRPWRLAVELMDRPWNFESAKFQPMDMDMDDVMETRYDR